jgi:hypothetical protein
MPQADTPKRTAEQVRYELRSGGSAEHGAGVQWFFKEEIQSHGWYTAALRKAAVLATSSKRKSLPYFSSNG